MKAFHGLFTVEALGAAAILALSSAAKGGENIPLNDGSIITNGTVMAHDRDVVIIETDSGVTRLARADIEYAFRETHGLLSRDEEREKQLEEEAATIAKWRKDHPDEARAKDEAAATAAKKEIEDHIAQEKEKLHDAQKAARRMEGMARIEAGHQPEIDFDGVNPSINNELKKCLKDPDSLRIIRALPPTFIIREGRGYWMIAFDYRAKNSFGGYTANTAVTLWQKGQMTDLMDGRTYLNEAPTPRSFDYMRSIGGKFGQ